VDFKKYRVECAIVCSGDMGTDKNKYEIIGGVLDVDMEKNAEDQLERQDDE